MNLAKYLLKYKINTNIHYIPIHFQSLLEKIGFKKKTFDAYCEDYYKRALSIPIHQKLSKKLNLIVEKDSRLF